MWKPVILAGLLASTLMLEVSYSGFAADETDGTEPAKILSGENLKLAVTGNASSSRRIVSDPSEAENAIEELTRKLLLMEIALEKFNLNYKLNAAKQGRWKSERYAFFNEANGALGLTGGIISCWNRGIHIHRSSMTKTYIQEDANYIPEIGSFIGAVAAILELAINEYHEYQAFTRGFSPVRARDHVNSLKSDINRLLADRDSLIKLEQSAPLLNGRVQIDSLEGRVLTDLRDQSLLEYQRFHLDARRLLAFQQGQYLFDFSKNVTNSLGCQFAFLALHRGRRPWNWKAGVLFDVSGALTMGGPVISRLYAKSVSEYHRHYLHDTIKEAEIREVAQLEQDQKELDTIIRSDRFNTGVVGEVVERAVIYSDHSRMFKDEIESASRELQKIKLVAGENAAAGMFIGGTKLASGILFNACGYPQLYNQGSSNLTSTRVTNQLLFSGSAVGLPGTAFGMLDTLRIQLQGELNRHKLAEQGELPSQLIQKRLAQLDSMEAKLNAAAHP